MPVFIDGNNLLHAAYADEPERPISRAALCARLGEWAVQNQANVTVIFDGPEPPPGLAAQTAHSALNVIYSGAGVTADAVIIERIRSDVAGRSWWIVTSDREIVRAARGKKAVALRSADFWELVNADLAAAPPKPLEPPEKYRGLSSEQTTQWIHDLGLEGEAPDDPADEMRRKPE